MCCHPSRPIRSTETRWHNLVAKQDMLVQPFLTNVVRAGEVSLIWIDGSHTQRVRAGQIGISGSRTTTEEPSISSMWTPKWHRWPKTSWTGAFPCAQNEIGSLHSMPVDVMRGESGEWMVSELEMVEPELWFRFCPEEAHILARPSKSGWTPEQSLSGPDYVGDGHCLHRATFWMFPKGRFPMQKYSLLRDQIVHEGLATAASFRPKAMLKTILLAHDAEYWRRTLHGEWSKQKIRRSGFPWSASMVEHEGHHTRHLDCAFGPCPQDRR